MKLFYSPGSCSLAPHILLEEIGHPYQLEKVLVAEGQTQTPQYLAINPKGRIPALEIREDLILTELPAISFYLARSDDSARLIPRDPLLEARCIEWFNWLSGAVHAVAFGQIWRPARFVQNETIFTDIKEKGRLNVLENFAFIEKQLQDRIWAVGKDYSLVDPYLLVFYYWGIRIGLDMSANYSAWSKHTENLMQRPTVIAALKQEGIDALVKVN